MQVCAGVANTSTRNDVAMRDEAVFPVRLGFTRNFVAFVKLFEFRRSIKAGVCNCTLLYFMTPTHESLVSCIVLNGVDTTYRTGTQTIKQPYDRDWQFRNVLHLPGPLTAPVDFGVADFSIMHAQDTSHGFLCDSAGGKP